MAVYTVFFPQPVSERQYQETNSTISRVLWDLSSELEHCKRAIFRQIWWLNSPSCPSFKSLNFARTAIRRGTTSRAWLLKLSNASSSLEHSQLIPLSKSLIRNSPCRSQSNIMTSLSVSRWPNVVRTRQEHRCYSTTSRHSGTSQCFGP